MAKKILIFMIAAGVLGFFVGSVMENEMVYSVSACVAVYSGLATAVIGRKAPDRQ